ncbi:MAG TPA: family 10 glycosylhydrolase [Tepidisphaeraceae bacterium]|nr:family 10 glycosylhydrolase [Tepidisphaeraceae bacterium]
MITRSVLLAILLVLPRALHAADPEIRATWLTTTSSTHLSAANLQPTMNDLRQIGLNTVYVEAFKNGYTNFPSPTLQAFTGVSSLNPSLGGRNLIAESKTAAGNANLIHGAWLEYGLAAGFGNPANPLANKMRDNGWLLRDQSGNFTNSSNGFSWMNPLVPEVRNLIKGIAIDAVTQHNLQIIQFDDRLSWPVEFGYDDYTRARYLAETGNNLPSNPRSTAFSNWRRSKMQAFVQELHDAIRAAKPGIVISLAPSIQSFSRGEYLADWSAWAATGMFDELIPQAYRSNISDFNGIWPAQISAAGSNTDKLAGGLRILGTGAATPWADLQQMIDQTRATGAIGHSLWFSNGVTGAGSYRDQLIAYYNVAGLGHAPHPLFIPEPASLGLLALLAPLLARRNPIRVARSSIV